MVGHTTTHKHGPCAWWCAQPWLLVPMLNTTIGVSQVWRTPPLSIIITRIYRGHSRQVDTFFSREVRLHASVLMSQRQF